MEARRVQIPLGGHYRSNEPKAGEAAGVAPIPPVYPFDATVRSPKVMDTRRRLCLPRLCTQT
jgi:hypothetical protein